MPTLLPAAIKTRQTRPGRNVDARMRPSEEVLTPAAEALSARAASVRGPRISNQCRTRLAFVRLLSQFALVSPSCVGLARIQATSRARGVEILSVDGLGRISFLSSPNSLRCRIVPRFDKISATWQILLAYQGGCSVPRRAEPSRSAGGERHYCPPVRCESFPHPARSRAATQPLKRRQRRSPEPRALRGAF